MEIAESRQALSAEAVRAALTGRGWSRPIPDPRASVTDLSALALRPGETVVAESVGAGLGGTAAQEPGAALWAAHAVDVSDADPARLGWLPLVAALAAADALRDAGRVPGEVVWPDVVTIPGAMCGGDAGTRSVGSIAVSVHDDVALLQLGLLVSLGMLELPRRTTSVFADGGAIDRAELLAGWLVALDRRIAQWRDDDPALRLAYRDRCQTLGRVVEVGPSTGRVRTIDDAGRLVVDVDGSLQVVELDEPVPAFA